MAAGDILCVVTFVLRRPDPKWGVPGQGDCAGNRTQLLQPPALSQKHFECHCFGWKGH